MSEFGCDGAGLGGVVAESHCPILNMSPAHFPRQSLCVSCLLSVGSQFDVCTCLVVSDSSGKVFVEQRLSLLGAI